MADPGTGIAEYSVFFAAAAPEQDEPRRIESAGEAAAGSGGPAAAFHARAKTVVRLSSLRFQIPPEASLQGGSALQE